jgi:hypothetical protein
MCSAQRLPNGNTLISAGVSGQIFEVAPDRPIVWRQAIPHTTAADRAALNQVPDRREPPMRQEILPAVSPGVNPLFRALRYDAHYAGLAGKHLAPAG